MTSSESVVEYYITLYIYLIYLALPYIIYPTLHSPRYIALHQEA